MQPLYFDNYIYYAPIPPEGDFLRMDIPEGSSLELDFRVFIWDLSQDNEKDEYLEWIEKPTG